MNFIAIIPARRASSRLPNKPLANIDGKPMIVQVAQRAVQSGASRVLVATDDQEILDVTRSHGYQACMTRVDHPSGTDRLSEVVEQLALVDDAIVVNVQGDEPLISPALIARCAHVLANTSDCVIATPCHAIRTADEMFNPNVVKVVSDAQGRALYFSRAPIPWERDTLDLFRNCSERTSVGGGGSAGSGMYGVVHEDSDAFANFGPTPNHGRAVSSETSLLHQERPALVQAQRHIGLYAYRAGFLKVFPKLPQAPLEQLEALEQLRALWHGYKIAVFATTDAPTLGVDTAEDLARVCEIYAPERQFAA